MHVISKRPLVEASAKYTTCASALTDVYLTLAKASFSTPAEMRRVFPSLDNFKHKHRWWVLDVGGNKLRVIMYIQFQAQRIYIKHILSHAEYDKLCKRFSQGGLS